MTLGAQTVLKQGSYNWQKGRLLGVPEVRRDGHFSLTCICYLLFFIPKYIIHLFIYLPHFTFVNITFSVKHHHRPRRLFLFNKSHEVNFLTLWFIAKYSAWMTYFILILPKNLLSVTHFTSHNDQHNSPLYNVIFIH